MVVITRGYFYGLSFDRCRLPRNMHGPFSRKEVDAVELVYSEFKNAPLNILLWSNFTRAKAAASPAGKRQIYFEPAKKY